MIDTITSRLFSTFDPDRMQQNSKKTGVYIYRNTFLDQLIKFVSSLFGRTLSVTLSLAGESKKIDISKVSLQKFLQRAKVDNPYALSNEQLRTIVGHLSRRIPEDTSFNDRLRQLQQHADAFSQKCQRVEQRQYGNSSYQELTAFAKQTSEGIKQWCVSRIAARSTQRIKVLSEETLVAADPRHIRQEQQDRRDFDTYRQMLERVSQAQDSLASLCLYARDKYRGDKARFPDFRIRREVLDLFKEGAVPSPSAVSFVHHMYALVHDCENAYEAAKARVVQECGTRGHPELVPSLLQEIARLVQPLLDTDCWPPVSPPGSEKDLMVLMGNLSGVDSAATRAYVEQKKQEFREQVEKLLHSIQPRPLFVAPILAAASRHGLQTRGTLETYTFPTEDAVYWQLARENEYRFLPPGAGSDPFVLRYNQWVRESLQRDLQSLDLQTRKTTRPVNTLEEYLDEVARTNSFATCDKNCGPQVERLRIRYNQRAEYQRNQWLSQPHYAALPRIMKITKRHLTKILPYRIERPLGKGSSKVAHQITVFRPHERPQKIKVLGSVNLEGHQDQISQIRKVNAELVQEHQISEEFRQKGVPNLAFLRRVTSLDGQTSYAYMDFCEGGQLDTYCSQFGGALPPKDKLSMAQELSQALAGMHAFGYCHGDMKTYNVLIQMRREPDGTFHPHAKLSDFGYTVPVGTQGQKGLQGTIVSPEQREECLAHRPNIFGTATKETELWILADLLYTIKYGRSLFFEECPRFTGTAPTWGHYQTNPNFMSSYAYIAHRREEIRGMLPIAQRTDQLVGIDRLIVALLSDDPRGRPTAQQVVDELQRIRIA